MKSLQMEAEEGSRLRQVLVAALICGSIAILTCSLLLGWHYVPGFLGEWLGMIAGFISTPFLLEGSFALLGIFLVISLNSWRRHREGDEFVYLEQVDGPEVPANLPDSARWAVYTKAPLVGEEPSLLTRAEGTLAIGDHGATAELIAEMSESELRHPSVLALRRELARATGNHQAEQRLAREIEDLQTDPNHPPTL
ncbi:hypothetical protein JIN85_12995 [Luteolibacter pohnpeiensis]|uniref:Uncharacterized protein n=1 Tax=Luteolibacter pohnpeiensis TaxID=454153 RepID=A0A934S6X9_9BACT|nr:hypothetical protein [Luteolibacter pohnpeiensis]MBK1883337.1 hypothetical protein [Luteolibacter pohnpeiensis]